MSWRVVVIQKRCKLEYKLGYLVCRGEEQKKVYLDYRINGYIVNYSPFVRTYQSQNQRCFL